MNSRTYVVNLERRPDRWDKFEKAAKRAGFTEYKRFNAVDGTKIPKRSPLLKIFDGNDHNYRRGIIGCALSHYRLWQMLINSDCDYFLILEDDIEFSNNALEEWNKAFNRVRELDNNWGLMYLAGPCSYAERNTMSGIPVTGESNLIRPLESEIHRTRTSMTTLGYAISKNSARTLVNLAATSGMKQSVDWFMIKSYSHVPSYARVPYLAYARNVNDTDIQKDFENILVTNPEE